MSKISVVFWTQGGNTESMANAVVEGIKEAAKEAKAVYKIDKVALVNCEIFEKYLETFREY